MSFKKLFNFKSRAFLEFLNIVEYFMQRHRDSKFWNIESVTRNLFVRLRRNNFDPRMPMIIYKREYNQIFIVE